MKTVSLVIMMVFVTHNLKAQYCSADIRPDYRELINHSHESNYRPCQNQSRKAWFYVQQQRLENRMEKLMSTHKSQIQSLAGVYANYIKQYYYWDYTSRAQFERGINFLFNIDTTLDEIQTGKANF